MREIEKIREAEYFYTQMSKTEEDSEAFKYNLSAFLSAARSVLQFAREEAITKSKGQYWYDTCVSKKPVISFFKDKRDINIHKEPIKIKKDIKLILSDALHLTASVLPMRIVTNDENNNITSENKPEEVFHEAETKIPPKAIYKYRFNNWTGNEDIPTLCQKYIDELKAITADGLKEGLLS